VKVNEHDIDCRLLFLLFRGYCFGAIVSGPLLLAWRPILVLWALVKKKVCLPLAIAALR
jgi:hypothetical protein